MDFQEGKFTVETFAKKHNLSRSSALNKLSLLKSQGYVLTSGGGRQKRMYTVSKKFLSPANGFYSVVNKYSPEKLVPKFVHRVHGFYSIERAIIDGILIGDVRTLEATKYLFNHVKNWKRLFDLAKQHGLSDKVYSLYLSARKSIKCKRIPKRYER